MNKQLIEKHKLKIIIMYVVILILYCFFTIYRNATDEPFYSIRIMHIVHHIIISEVFIILSLVIIKKIITDKYRLWIKITFICLIFILCLLLIDDSVKYLSDLTAINHYIDYDNLSEKSRRLF